MRGVVAVARKLKTTKLNENRAVLTPSAPCAGFRAMHDYTRRLNTMVRSRAPGRHLCHMPDNRGGHLDAVRPRTSDP